MNVVEMRGICKCFGNFYANTNVDFDLQQGELHGLLGENGAGKSTLMNVLYGLYSHDSGTIRINSKECTIKSPKDAIAHGVGMVHQHFALIPQLTVTENIFLGMKQAGFVLNQKDLERQVQQMNDAFGFNVDPKAYIWQLPVGIQQKVEILKVLIRKAQILILDEPTAVLTPQEVSELFASLKKLALNGCSIIIITHKIEDVLANCDHVTVLRNGCVAGNAEIQNVDQQTLANMMIGRDISLDRKSQIHPFGNVLLRAEQLCAKNDKGLEALKRVSFDIRAGEVLGIAGVDGNGQLELGESLTGLRRFSGKLFFENDDLLSHVTPGQLIRKGLGHIPDDRHKKGLILSFTVKDNLILASQRDKRYARGIFLKKTEIARAADRLLEQFDIRPRDQQKLAGELSGGNQQKVILAREFDRDPQVLIAIQPTRGLDIGAIEFVWRKIIEARDAGKAILLISTDLDEIRCLSDTISVMFDGNLSEKLPYDVSVSELGLRMSGHFRASAAEEEEVVKCIS